jgi:hypothetical protein
MRSVYPRGPFTSPAQWSGPRPCSSSGDSLKLQVRHIFALSSQHNDEGKGGNYGILVVLTADVTLPKVCNEKDAEYLTLHPFPQRVPEARDYCE